MAMIEDLAHLITDTLRKPISLAAIEIKSKGHLTELLEQEIVNSIESFRATRKGLEKCCTKLADMQRDREYKFPEPVLDDHIDGGILGSLTVSGMLGSKWNNGYPFRRP